MFVCLRFVVCCLLCVVCSLLFVCLFVCSFVCLLFVCLFVCLFFCLLFIVCLFVVCCLLFACLLYVVCCLLLLLFVACCLLLLLIVVCCYCCYCCYCHGYCCFLFVIVVCCLLLVVGCNDHYNNNGHNAWMLFLRNKQPELSPNSCGRTANSSKLVFVPEQNKPLPFSDQRWRTSNAPRTRPPEQTAKGGSERDIFFFTLTDASSEQNTARKSARPRAMKTPSKYTSNVNKRAPTTNKTKSCLSETRYQDGAAKFRARRRTPKRTKQQVFQ